MRGLALALAVVAAATPACGSRADPASEPLSARDRLLRPGELHGHIPEGTLLVSRKQDLSSGSESLDRARLRRLVVSLSQDLEGRRDTGGGIFFVNRYTTAAGARAETAIDINGWKAYVRKTGNRAKRFDVPGIRRAYGLLTDWNGPTVILMFSDGAFSYQFRIFKTDAKARPTGADVAAAALKLYRRVHEHPAP